MARRYIALDEELRKAGFNHNDLAAHLQISVTTMTNRFTNRQPFTAWEMYAIMDLLELPYSELPRLFPKEGLAAYAPEPSAAEAIHWIEKFASDINRGIADQLNLMRAAVAISKQRA